MLLNAQDYRRRARRRLPKGLFEYIDRGTEDEVALRQLRRSLDAITLTPSVLTGVTDPQLGVDILGRPCGAPLVVAPTALAGLVAHGGEVQLARAAAAANIPFCVSTQSVTTVEDIRAGAPDARLWFQLYVWRDRALTDALVDRARQSDCDALVITADTAASPKREYNARNGFAIPLVPSFRNVLDVAAHPRWFVGVLLRYLLTEGVPTYAHYPAAFRSPITRPGLHDAVRLDGGFDWSDVAALRRRWDGPLVVKGILSVDDARRAHDVGADAVVVSAHGGRNLDCAPTPAECLPRIADAVGDRMTVLADSGVMRGTDVLKYLALGATGVLVGRLPLWGLAAGGEAGAQAILGLIAEEMRVAMTFLGVETVARMPAKR